jgi:hypothetical protein
MRLQCRAPHCFTGRHSPVYDSLPGNIGPRCAPAPVSQQIRIGHVSQHFAPGDVVRSRDRTAVLCRVDGDRMLAWPVAYRPRERASDVPASEMTDRLALRAVECVVCAGTLFDVPRGGQQRLGAISRLMLLAVEAAARRAAVTIQIETRWQGEREHRQSERPVSL